MLASPAVATRHTAAQRSRRAMRMCDSQTGDGGVATSVKLRDRESPGARPTAPRSRQARLVAAVHGDHARAAEAEVVLQGDLGAFDLALAGEPAELLVQFEALRETGRAQGMPL